MSAVGVGDLFFGVAQVDPLGAGFAGMMNGPAVSFHWWDLPALRQSLICSGGRFYLRRLGRGGYGGEDSQEADHGWKRINDE